MAEGFKNFQFFKKTAINHETIPAFKQINKDLRIPNKQYRFVKQKKYYVVTTFY